ncbi:MAG: GH92 family glycosyl hydrolase [Bacteroidia bacterium]|nr:GH92 family glycosyl hydrolase [Bacteroidia bacterium]
MKYNFLLVPAFCLILTSCSQKNSDPVDFVNPNIGGISPLLETTVPLVNLPNSMMRINRLPGNYQAEKINGFPFILCGHRNGTAGLLMPAAGEISTDKKRWQSYYDHDYEVCTPYYYSVWLEDPDINLEFTVAEKSSFYQITWNKNKQKNLMMAVNTSGSFNVIDNNTVEGYEVYKNKVKVYFYIKTDKSFSSDSIWDAGNNAAEGIATLEGPRPSLSLTFNVPEKEKVGVKMGISFVDAEQARRNLETDIPGWNFESLEAKGREKWNNALGKIEVKGGTLDQKTVFYTALYRTYERMVNISEEGRYYSGFDDTIHNDNDTIFYVDDWMWDTYRAAHPLHAMLNPDMEGMKIQSFVRMYEQGGWMPSFPILFGDNPCMNGHHSAAIIADAYFKGIRNYDIEKAYEGLRKNAMEATMLPWRNGPMCSLDTFYLEKGYYPALNQDEKETVAMVHPFEKRQAVAITLGHSYDDWCLAQLAKALNKNDDYEYFLKRSHNFYNLFNSETGFFAPRTADGSWVKDFDPKLSGGLGNRDYYDENNGWTYLWDVQHDVAGLVELLGGREKFVSRLDRLFIEGLGMWKPDYLAKFPDATGQVGQFVMGNEPSLHIPYLYNYAGAPWKTQKRIRLLLDTWFTNSPFGIPGDEDGGGLSGFVVFSSIGFYPVTPGTPVFNIGSPVFTNVSVKLQNNKTFSIVAKKSSRQNKYIQKATLNGKEWNKPWFSWDDIKDGGELVLEMGSRPNYLWGSDPADVPPSKLDNQVLKKVSG